MQPSNCNISKIELHYRCFPVNVPKIFRTAFFSTRKCVFQKHSSRSVLKNITKFTGEHLWQSLFFNKVAGLRPVNFAKFQEHLFLQNTFCGCFWEAPFQGTVMQIGKVLTNDRLRVSWKFRILTFYNFAVIYP